MVSVLAYAWRSIKRHSDKSIFTVAGLSLAIASMLFVYTLGVSFSSDFSEVFRYEVGRGNDVWATPVGGFTIDVRTRSVQTLGILPETLLADFAKSNSNGTFPPRTSFVGIVSGIVNRSGTTLVVFGRSDLQNDAAVVTPTLLSTLKLKVGDVLSLGNQTISIGGSQGAPTPNLIQLPLRTAQVILGKQQSLSWISIKTSEPKAAVNVLAKRFGFVASSNPKFNEPNSNYTGVAYLLTGSLFRFDFFTFDAKLTSLFVGQVVSTALGSLSQVGLGLGFVLVVSTSILTLEERRREMGILTSIGVVTDVIYEFLAEMLILFVISTAVGILLGIAFVLEVIPQLFTLTRLLDGLLVVIAFFPPMIIFGALIPSGVVLSKKPVVLLRGAS